VKWNSRLGGVILFRALYTNNLCTHHQKNTHTLAERELALLRSCALILLLLMQAIRINCYVLNSVLFVHVCERDLSKIYIYNWNEIYTHWNKIELNNISIVVVVVVFFCTYKLSETKALSFSEKKNLFKCFFPLKFFIEELQCSAHFIAFILRKMQLYVYTALFFSHSHLNNKCSIKKHELK
jgi:hypothetical protein